MEIRQSREGGKLTFALDGQLDANSSKEFEKVLTDNGISRSYLPSVLTMNYWSGNGKSIVLKGVADGNGPSFMLEKNSIQTIVSGEFEDNGESCKIMKLDGSSYGGEVPRHKIPWICYNNQPSALSIEDASKSNSIQGTHNYNAGEFRKPAFTGREICDKINDDQAFVDLFGPHCENCFGKCETEVTFTGAANKIISGNIRVEAPAYSTRTIKLNDGTQLTYKERTGGLDNGILIVRCNPVSYGEGRMTKCVGLPKLLIYARERNMNSSKDPVDIEEWSNDNTDDESGDEDGDES